MAKDSYTKDLALDVIARFLKDQLEKDLSPSWYKGLAMHLLDHLRDAGLAVVLDKDV